MLKENEEIIVQYKGFNIEYDGRHAWTVLLPGKDKVQLIQDPLTKAMVEQSYKTAAKYRAKDSLASAKEYIDRIEQKVFIPFDAWRRRWYNEQKFEKITVTWLMRHDEPCHKRYEIVYSMADGTKGNENSGDIYPDSPETRDLMSRLVKIDELLRDIESTKSELAKQLKSMAYNPREDLIPDKQYIHPVPVDKLVERIG